MGRELRLVKILRISRRLLVVKGEEILEWLRFVLLVLSLQGFAPGRVKDLHIVLSVDFEALIFAVLLVESFI